MIKELDDITPLKKVVFVPPLRRRDGDGSVAESTVLVAYTIATESHEFTAIVATVSGAVTQLCLFTYVSGSSAAPHPLRLEYALTTGSQWIDGYTFMTQWHLIGEDEHAATKFIHDCAAWCSKIRDAILVFDQSQWRPDHGLWESVQKVSTAAAWACSVTHAKPPIGWGVPDGLALCTCVQYWRMCSR